MDMTKFEHKGKCLELSEGGLQYSVKAKTFSNGMAVIIPLSEIRQVEIQEYKGLTKPAFMVVRLRGGGVKKTDSNEFKYSIFFNSKETNVVALEFKRLVDIELVRFSGSGSKARGPIVESKPQTSTLLEFWRLVLISFVAVFVAVIFKAGLDGDGSSNAAVGESASTMIEADAYALITEKPQAQLSLISVEKTLSSPLSYHVRFSTENKNILTKSLGSMGANATKIFNRQITDMWTVTYCRDATMKIKRRYGIDILSASINHNNERHSTAICN